MSKFNPKSPRYNTRHVTLRSAVLGTAEYATFDDRWRIVLDENNSYVSPVESGRRIYLPPAPHKIFNSNIDEGIKTINSITNEQITEQNLNKQ